MNDFLEKDIDDIKEIYNLTKDCSNKYELTLKFFRFKVISFGFSSKKLNE